MRLLTLLSALLILSACAAGIKNMQDLKSHEAKRTLMYGRTPCFRGKCPEYFLNVYQDGWLSFQGKEHVEKMGWWVRKMTKAEQTEFDQYMAKYNFGTMKDEYFSGLSDVAATTFTFFQKDSIKSIAGDNALPDTLFYFHKMLSRFAGAEGWAQVGPPEGGQNPKVRRNVIQVSLLDSVDRYKWIKQHEGKALRVWEEYFGEAGVQWWYLNVDTAATKPEIILQDYKAKPGVRVAKFQTQWY
jgi:hypothetical protein